MFKGKKGTYLLILVNILVWGFFVYRFYSVYHETDEPTGTNESLAIKLDVIKDSVTYRLKINYDDPFLKKELKQRNESSNGQNTDQKSSVPKVVIPKQVTVMPQIQRPDIKYLGLVKNNASGIATAIVSVNGQSKLVKPNEIIDGVKFKSFSNDSLVASWGKEKIVVRK